MKDSWAVRLEKFLPEHCKAKVRRKSNRSIFHTHTHTHTGTTQFPVLARGHDGNVHFTDSSPAKPAFMIPVPLSMTTGWFAITSGRHPKSLIYRLHNQNIEI